MTVKKIEDSVWNFTPELMDDRQILDQYRLLSAKALEVFDRAIERENGIMALLEPVVTERDWREIRAHLTMLEACVDRFDIEKKKVILQYLFSLLFHENGSIRRLSARTTGFILSSCMEEDSQVFAAALHRILFQSGKKSDYKRRWIGNALKVMISAMYDRLDERVRKELLRIYSAYFKSSRWGRLSCLNLIEGIMDIPWDHWSSMQRGYIFDFLRNFLKTPDDELREAALWLLDSWISKGWYCPPDVKSYLKHLPNPEDARICERYLIARIHYMAKTSGQPSSRDWEKEAVKNLDIDDEVLFHENLQFDHFWIDKVINLDILKQEFAGREENALYQYATHLLNILRMNTQQEVFWRAGEDLVEIFPHILPHQKYEVIQEIFKAIELRDDSSNYIPSFLGRTFPLLKPDQQKELLGRIRLLADSRSRDTVKVIAETLCVIMASMGSGSEGEGEGGDFIRNQRRDFLGILCRCMAGYHADISLETIHLIGNVLCENEHLTGWESESFLYFVRKVLIYMRDTRACHGKVYMLPVISRITECLEKVFRREPEKEEGPEEGRRIAIFSDSFDPFTLGHRAVVQEAVESGYHVFLNVHNYFWAMNTQPLMIRRLIASMTIADIRGAWLLPADMPVNISRPEDLKTLTDLFPGREIYIITGSDAAGVTEPYLKEPRPGSIHHFPHIIYSKNELYGYPDMRKIRNKIFGHTVYLKLPVYYDNMTSDKVREALEEGREVEDMIDPLARHMIRDWNLYSETATYKQLVEMDPIEDVISRTPNQDGEEVRLAIRDAEKGNEYASIRCRIEETEGVKTGEILSIEGMEQESVREFVLQELLAICTGEGCRSMTCSCPDIDRNILTRTGFLCERSEGKAEALTEGIRDRDKAASDHYRLDMSRPIAMFFDASSYIKEPYDKDPAVQEAIIQGRTKLKESLIGLYPGSLVMHIDAGVLHYKINRLISRKNDITDPEAGLMDGGGLDESMGNKLCVPFGKILKGIRIPHTVTKVLNAEKVYDEELRHFEFRELPDYPGLPTQIRTIRSFDMPVILVDDVYHKGFRMARMSQLLSAESVDVSGLIVGVMSGRGRDLAASRGLDVESVYYVPSLRAWLLESDLYPFIGGDGILSDQTGLAGRSALPSINTLLPYQMPSFLKESTDEAILELSRVCLDNSRNIFRALEQAYRNRHHRTLTLERIKEVMIEPRYPEGIDLSDRTMRSPVSEILTREIHRLARLYR